MIFSYASDTLKVRLNYFSSRFLYIQVFNCIVFIQHLSVCVNLVVCCVLIGGSCMEIKTEADSNDITECPHDDKPTTGMFGLSDAVFSAFICLCIALYYV